MTNTTESAPIVRYATGANGLYYVYSRSINAVREQLRANGFECGRYGWRRESDGELSAIFYNDGEWSAVLGRAED